MGGNRVGPSRHFTNLLVTFGVSGLWHGANWTYVCWGLLNGFYLIMGGFTKDFRERNFSLIGLHKGALARRAIMLASTFALTCAGWVLFRAQSLEDAWYILTHFASGWDFARIGTEQFLLRQMPVAVAGILLLEVGQLLQRRVSISAALARLSLMPRWAVYASFVIGVLMFGVYRKTQFIYFQF